jgi:hypothetical protein
MKKHDTVELVIADGSIMDSIAVQSMIEHIADGAKFEKADYVGCDLTVTLRNGYIDHTDA